MTTYPKPKQALYHSDTNEYGPDGWIQEPVVAKVIGEDETSYIQEVRTSSGDEWEAGQLVPKTYEIPIGFNKSRLITWLPVQLQLF